MPRGFIALDGVAFAIADVVFRDVRFVGAPRRRPLVNLFEGPIRVGGLPEPLHNLARAVRREVLLGDVGDDFDALYIDLGGEG